MEVRPEGQEATALAERLAAQKSKYGTAELDIPPLPKVCSLP